MGIIRNYLIALIVFFAIDILWLGFITKGFYRKNLSHLMAPKTNVIAAVIFYSVYVGGLMFFAINPALDKNSIMYALSVGALFGFMTYATYDMTNLATLRDWPIKITIIDIIWGTVLNAITASATFYIVKLFER